MTGNVLYNPTVASFLATKGLGGFGFGPITWRQSDISSQANNFFINTGAVDNLSSWLPGRFYLDIRDTLFFGSNGAYENADFAGLQSSLTEAAIARILIEGFNGHYGDAAIEYASEILVEQRYDIQALQELYNTGYGSGITSPFVNWIDLDNIYLPGSSAPAFYDSLPSPGDVPPENEREQWSDVDVAKEIDKDLPKDAPFKKAIVSPLAIDLDGDVNRARNQRDL